MISFCFCFYCFLEIWKRWELHPCQPFNRVMGKVYCLQSTVSTECLSPELKERKIIFWLVKAVISNYQKDPQTSKFIKMKMDVFSRLATIHSMCT